VVIVSSRNEPKILGTFDEENKAEQRLKDWVDREIEDGHMGDSKSRHTGEASECELCDLRKFKTEHTQELFNGKRQYRLWDNRVGYVEQKVLE